MKRIFFIFLLVILIFPGCSLFFDSTPPDEVTNLKIIPGDMQVKLSWYNPYNTDFTHVEIWYGQDQNNLKKFIGSTINEKAIITGLSNGHLYYFKVVTIDKNGNKSKGIIKKIYLNLLWEKTYGGSNSECGNSILKTPDENFIIVGYTSSSDRNLFSTKEDYFTINMDAWILKVSQNGELIWDKTFGGSDNDELIKIIKTDDGNFIAAGKTYSTDGDIESNNGQYDIWIIKIDNFGNLLWEKTFGGSYYDKVSSIIKTYDNNYIILGLTESSDGDISQNNGEYDIWLIKINDEGNLLWEKTFGGSSSEKAFDVIEDSDKNLIIVGYTESEDGIISYNHGEKDLWVIKTDENGNLIWEKTFGGSDWESGNKIIQTDDGNYLISGYTNSSDGDVSFLHSSTYYSSTYGDAFSADIWVIKIDTNGNLLWEKTYGGSSWDETTDLIKTSEGNIYIVGTSWSYDGDIPYSHGVIDSWVFSIDPEGTILWNKTFGGTDLDGFLDMIELSPGKMIATGTTSSSDYDIIINHGGSDLWLVVFDTTN